MPFKGRIFFRQYIPRKPHSTGIKYWAIVDQYGYLYGFEIYIGRKQRNAARQSTTADLAASVISGLVAQVSCFPLRQS
jgi:hypothetical protein